MTANVHLGINIYEHDYNQYYCTKEVPIDYLEKEDLYNSIRQLINKELDFIKKDDWFFVPNSCYAVQVSNITNIHFDVYGIPNEE